MSSVLMVGAVWEFKVVSTNEQDFARFYNR